MIETDYLVIGGGGRDGVHRHADRESDADVVMIDRRHAPGGHWNGVPVVRLHQPAAYNVNSRKLGNDTIDTSGENAGMYERATAAQICDYYQRVLDEHLVRRGRSGSSACRTTWVTTSTTAAGATPHPVNVNGVSSRSSRCRDDGVRKKIVDALSQAGNPCDPQALVRH
jgi:hypothetical protein